MFLADRKKLAKALEVTPEIIPYLARLLADIHVLGSWPDEIVELLQSLNLPPQPTEVLDLGCGKGAVSLTLARELGFRIRGVDLFPPFIEEAAKRAAALDLATLCQFEIGDINDVIQEDRAYDIVIFASVGGVLGDLAQSVRKLRKAIRPGGYILIDDGFLAHSSRSDRPGYKHYRSHEETIRQLTSHGDILLQEKIVPVARLKACNQRNTELIRKRANDLAKLHPDIAVIFEKYIQWEEEESIILETETIPAVWLLHRR